MVLVDHLFLEMLLDLVLIYVMMILRLQLRVTKMVILEGAACKLERLHLSVVGIHLFVMITHIEIRVSTVKMISMVSW